MTAFDSGQQLLAEAALLAHPNKDATIALTVDASDVSIGAVLEQKAGDSWQPLAFLSQQLRPPELKYSTYDCELLSLYLAVKHFRYYMEGRSFTLYTDHKPLVAAMSKTTDPLTPRQQRQLAYVSEFTTAILHVAGKYNVVADCLSRADVNDISLGIDFLQKAKAQTDTVQAYRTANNRRVLADIAIYEKGPTLLCDVSIG